jgi:hypothetical protein
MTHKKVGEASDGVLQGVFSASATKLYHPPETYATPDVDDGVVCTCHWNSVGYHEPIGGCVGYSQ